MKASPEWYYEENLKGKSEEQIRAEIRSLQREIKRLRRIIDYPDYPNRKDRIKPDEGVRLAMAYAYLQKARETLMDTIEYLKDEGKGPV